MHGILKRRLEARTLPPVTIRELRLARKTNGQQCLNNSLTPLILSMGRTVKPFSSHGDHIPKKTGYFLLGTITGMYLVALRSMLKFQSAIIP
ncbi:hypothetical protein TNCV_4491851 [Trichonephila clavipes]|nr:hypothetical protein TNCV_4491851 [Trichonephila clavipes]